MVLKGKRKCGLWPLSVYFTFPYADKQSFCFVHGHVKPKNKIGLKLNTIILVLIAIWNQGVCNFAPPQFKYYSFPLLAEISRLCYDTQTRHCVVSQEMDKWQVCIWPECEILDLYVACRRLGDVLFPPLPESQETKYTYERWTRSELHNYCVSVIITFCAADATWVGLGAVFKRTATP